MSSTTNGKQDKQGENADTPISEKEKSAFEIAIKELIPTKLALSVMLETISSISETDLEACFNLIELTSSAAYKASSRGWCPKQKWREMKEDGMRYVLVFESEGESKTKTKAKAARKLLGFISYMITEEDAYDVIYVYEIHLSAALRGKGVGSALMSVVHRIALAVGMEMSMLTVFTSNEGAIRLYERLGYEKWDEEPIISKRKKLRSGIKEVKPSYVILAKKLGEVDTKAV